MATSWGWTEAHFAASLALVAGRGVHHAGGCATVFATQGKGVRHAFVGDYRLTYAAGLMVSGVRLAVAQGAYPEGVARERGFPLRKVPCRRVVVPGRFCLHVGGVTHPTKN